MNPAQIGILLLVGVCVTGCDGTGPGMPGKKGLPSGGSSSNLNGVGKAKIMGVRIDVEETGGNNSNVERRHTGAGSDSADITLGTFQIQLQQKTHNSMSLKINGSNYGLLLIGDHVFIDQSGVVSVNAVVRTAAGQP